MATQTTHYNLIKPSSADRVAVGDLNDNADTIDGYLYQANERADQIADDYNTSSTYNTGDYVRRENYLYKCNTDNTTGTWDSTKWDRVKVMESVETAEDGVDNAFKTMGVMGAKNLIPYPFDNLAQRGINGVTFTANEDGILSINGTNSVRNTGYTLLDRANASIWQEGKYILSCEGIENCTDATIYLRVQEHKNGSWVRNLAEVNKTNTSVVFDYAFDDTFDAVSVIVQFADIGSRANNVTLKPMLRVATASDSNYEQFALTNRRITDRLQCPNQTAGTYILQATVDSSYHVTYEWVSTT